MRRWLLILIVFSPITGLTQSTPYNKFYQVACHNCYDPMYTANIEDVFPYTSVIEIDIWDNFRGTGVLSAGNKMKHDWYVKHDVLQKGNVNCCGGSLNDCLKRIKAWSDKNPTHKVVTIFVDKKENWSDQKEDRKPADLDQLITGIFSKASIYAPADLLKDKKDLRQAVWANWPPLDSLKGKFIFVITDGTEITGRKPLNEYLVSQKNEAICFVAPQVSSAQDITRPVGFTPENVSSIIFFNLKYPSDLSINIASINCVSRIFGSPESMASYNELIRKKVNFIALNNYKLIK